MTGIIEKLFIGKKGETFSHDETLPALPVPDLRHTLDRYLDSVKPHLTEQEFQNTASIVKRFEENEGHLLHEKLLKFAEGKKNWLEKWWEEYAYLRFRMPLAPFMNFAGPGPHIEHYWPPTEGTVISRTATSTYYILKFWQLIRQEILKVDMSRSGTCFAMNTFRRLFNCCKLPGKDVDSLHYYFKTVSDGTLGPTHLAAVYKKRFFVFNAIDENEEPLSVPELRRQFQFIKDKCDGEPAGPGVGALTSENRTTWFHIRDYLKNLSTRNSKNLEMIEKSLVLFALDDAHAPGYTEIMKEGLSGDCTNRWFDKGMCFITYQDGTFGTNCDHNPFDAMVAVKMMYFMDLSIQRDKGQWTGSSSIRPMSKPLELIFDLDSKLYKNIQDAIVQYKKNASNVECINPTFNHFGKKCIQSLKLHPDTFIQLALHMTYYRMYKRPASTYETAATRKYYNGRTETLRSCTMEALEWSKAMLDSKLSKQAKYNLFKKAYERHNFLMAEGQNGLGCDRHLLGLYIIATEEGLPIPDLYTDKAWVKSGGGGNYILSTSYVGSSTVGGGVAAMCKGGYGCFYRTEDHRLIFCITAWVSDEETSVLELFKQLSKSMLQMRELLESVQSSNM